MTYWKRMPAEFYLLVLPSILGFIIALFVGWDFFSSDLARTGDFLRVGLFTGVLILSPILMVVLCYLLGKLLLYLSKNITLKVNTTSEQDDLIKLIKSIFLFLAIVWLSALPFLLLMFFYTNNSQMGLIVKYSRQFMSWDMSIFSVYPGFWLNGLWSGLLFEKTIIMIYDYLVLALLSLFVFFLFFDKTLFRQFLISVLFVMIVSQPFWYLFPSVSPSWLYYRNSYKLSASERQLNPEIVGYRPNQFMIKKIDLLEKFWIGKKKNKFAVTNNPSMHMAWGVLIAYFLSKFWWPLVFLSVPLAFFNGLGAIYNLEHYGVDIISGFLVAILTIAIVEWLVRREKKLGIEPKLIHHFVDVLQEDFRKLIGFYKELSSVCYRKLKGKKR